MARIKFLILALLFACNVSFAGYAQLKPPPGWSQGLTAVQGQAGTFAFGPASNYTSFRGGTVLTNSALNVAGQLVTIPVSMRVAANAATAAAEWSFGNPYLFTAALVAPFAYKWFKDSGLTVQNGAWVKRESSSCTTTTCTEYSACMTSALGRSYCSAWMPNMEAAASSAATSASGEYHAYSYSAACPSGSCVFSYSGPNGSTGEVPGSVNARTVALADAQTTPVQLPDFLRTIQPSPMPAGVPSELPLVRWPVQTPVFNPDPEIEPLPNPSPAAVPRPYFVPTGNPVPTSDPAVWNQPGIRVSPAPLPDSPWRVDAVPENIPQNSPTPKTPAELNPAIPLPPGTPAPSDKLGLCDQYPGIAACAPAGPTPEQVKDFCVVNPDVVACKKLDTVEPDPLDTKDKMISISPDSGWGGGGGSCPAPRHFSKGDFSFQMYCDFASGIRPVIIAVAWLIAAGILIGFKFGES